MYATWTLIFGFLLAFEAAAEEDLTWSWQSFRSTDSDPPSLKVTKHGETAPGYLFFAQLGPDAHNYSNFIMSEDNELIWKSQYGAYNNFRPQTFQGEQVLVYHNGVSFSEPYGFGYGIVQLLNSSYDSIYNVSLTVADGNYHAFGGFNESLLYSWIDIHEAHITPQDTMLVTLYNVTRADLSSIGGPVHGWVTDSLFYEIDIVTNEILFSWSALEHEDQIPLAHVTQFYPLEDYGRNSTLPYGYFHINSIDKFQDGSYLISSRFFSSIFKIGKDGNVEWTLQGKSGGDFELGPNISFRYQHDARIRKETPDGVVISFFNNDNSGVVYGVNETNGLILVLDTHQMKATLLMEYEDPKDVIYAASQGNLQVLPDDHVFMSHGSTPKFKEYSPDGKLLMDIDFGYGDGEIFSYRGFKSPWIGRPRQAPSVYACRSSRNETKVFMSWNGATEHRKWSVFTGESKQDMSLARTACRTGYETTAVVKGTPAFVQVQAFGPDELSPRSEAVRPEDSC